MKACFLVAAIAASCCAQAQQMPSEIGAQTCRDEIARKYFSGESDKAMIGAPMGGKVEVIDYYSQKVPARRYVVTVSYRQETCLTSEDGRRILRLGAS